MPDPTLTAADVRAIDRLLTLAEAAEDTTDFPKVRLELATHFSNLREHYSLSTLLMHIKRHVTAEAVR